jgi:AraC-like DNA-binding protein
MTHALTRASTVGPVVEAARAAGASVRRLFHDADLPAGLLDRPDSLILLRDQFRLVENAARMIGDDALPARLSTSAGLDGLGPYGRHVMSFPDLGSAISLAYRDYGRLLQASTRMELRVRDGMAVWTYRITAPLTVGRQKNELLALGYMLGIVRRFAGSAWAPDRVEIPGRLAGRAAIEDVFACSVSSGPEAAVAFPAELLDCPAPIRSPGLGDGGNPVPAATDVAAVAGRMVALERLCGRSGVSAVAGRMGMTVRTLQRRLAERGATFSGVARQAEAAEAAALLDQGLSVTETADRLGYSDVAHFSRAFRRWTGLAPSRWSSGR